MGRLVFSGHDTFTCKQFWLKKGFDFLDSGKKFSDKTAVIDLGVGKNMVQSIKFWMHAFGISENKEQPSELGKYLFGEDSKDLFLEDIGSIWLLHYFLVKRDKASIYHLVFNGYRSAKNNFTKEELHLFLKKKCDENKSTAYTKNTVDRDIGVFINNYLKPSRKESEVEVAYSGLLHELNLLEFTQKEKITIQENFKKKREFEDSYYFDTDSKESLPYQVVLFAIMDNSNFGNTISFNDLLLAENSPGRIFVINSECLYDKIEKMVQNHKEITYSETAGNRVLQIDSSLNKWNILNDYYQQ